MYIENLSKNILSAIYSKMPTFIKIYNSLLKTKNEYKRNIYKIQLIYKNMNKLIVINLIWEKHFFELNLS